MFKCHYCQTDSKPREKGVMVIIRTKQVLDTQTLRHMTVTEKEALMHEACAEVWRARPALP